MSAFRLPRLLPKEDKFCTLLEGLAVQAGACALHLKTYIESAQEQDRRKAGQEISNNRARAKILAAEMTKELCHKFVTPFDREDIQDITDELYKIPKTIEKVKDRIAMHGLVLDKGDFLRQIDLIVQEAEAMESMVRDLVARRNSQQIQDKVAILYELEHKGDIVLGELLVSLFKGDYGARDLILRKDIYDMLEKIIDRYRDAAGIALQMVLKHT